MSFKRYLFGGGAMGGGQTQTPDSLFTTDTIELLVGLGEGPIQGPVDPTAIYADNTALQNSSGEPNLAQFSLDFWPGADGTTTVNMLLGGVATPTVVGVQLAQAEPVVHTTSQQNLDYVDVRLVIEELGKDDKDGSFAMNLGVLIECKPTSSGTWAPAFVGSAATSGTPLSGTGSTTATNFTNNNPIGALIASFTGDKQIVAGAGAPTATPTDLNAVGFDTTDATKVYHWDSGSPSWYQAAITAVNSRYGTYVDPNTSATIRVYITATAPTDARLGDVWRKSSTDWLIWNGSSWVDPAVFENYEPNPVSLVNGVFTFNGKVSSATPISIRVQVDNIADTYDFRVTKQTFDNTTASNGDTLTSLVSWESLQEIKSQPFTFENLAMVRLLARATNQFTSLPAFSVVGGGRIVNVPVNYDPVARTYTGIWDGTFKKAYTSNPAWCALDFVQNASYGLSSVYPQNANVWAFYAWGQSCDVMVPKADGTLQPRWTYNDLITEPRDAREMIQYICGSAGALYVDDGAGNVTVVVDQDDPAVAVFTRENVSPDGFQYTYTDRLTRANDTRPKFINPTYNWVADQRQLVDQSDVDTYGRIVDNFIAVGCIDPDEVMRRARRRQVIGLTEKEFVSFATNRKGRYLSEWDIILVADANMGFGDSRRVRAVTGARTVSLRDPITLESGFSYQATFDYPNPDYPATSSEPFATSTFDITTAAGTVSALTFDADLPSNLPEYATFALGCAGVVGLPKPYRILKIEDDSGSGEVIKITALELNRAKFSYIDGTATGVVPIQYSVIDTQTVQPPASPTIAVSQRLVNGQPVWVLTVAWQASPSAFVSTYHVYHSLNGAAATLIDSQGQLTIEIVGASPGIHQFDIYAANAYNRDSLQPASVAFDITGAVKAINAPTSLTGDFSTRDAVFNWAAAVVDPNFDHYQVEILVGGIVMRTVSVQGGLSYTYDFVTNQADNTTASRTVEASLCAVDVDGTLSDPITLSLTNSAPTLSLGQPTVTAAPMAISFAFDQPVALDYKGIKVWMSTASGFTPGPGNVVWDGMGQPTIPASPTTTYYYVWAIMDEFGAGTASAQGSVHTPDNGLSTWPTTAPAVPVGLALSTVLTLDTDGHQVVGVTASWTANTETDLDHYEVEFQLGGGSFVVFPTTTTAYSWPVLANKSITIGVRAVDVYNNKSAYCTTQTITSAKDTTAPSAPTSLSALASFGAIFLTWTNPTAADLETIQVFENTTNSSSTATQIATVNGNSGSAGGYTRSGLATGQTRFYWLKAVDTSGNLSVFSSGVSATTASVAPADLSPTPPATPGVPTLTTALGLDTDNHQQVTLSASWTAVTGAVQYVVSIQQGVGAAVTYLTNGTSYALNVPGNVSCTVQVAATNSAGATSVFGTSATLTSAADATAPGVPTAVSASAGLQSNFLAWTNPTAADLDHVEVWYNTASTSGTATKIAAVAASSGAPGSYTHDALTSAVQLWYWLKAVDTSGNTSAFSARVTATPNLVGMADVSTTALAVPGAPTLTSTLSLDTDATQQVALNISWTAVTGAVQYVIAVQQGSGAFVNYLSAGASFSLPALANTSYTAKIASVNGLGAQSAFGTSTSATTTLDTTAPAVATSLTATGAVQAIFLAWTNPTAADLSHIEVWSNTTNSSSTATKLATVEALSAAPGTYVQSGIATGTTLYYWLKAVDTSGNASGFSAQANAATAPVSAADLGGSAPTAPAAPTLASALSLDTDGSQVVTLTVTWAAVTGVIQYVVAIQLGSGSFSFHTVNGLSFALPVLANTTYTAKIASLNGVGLQSAFGSTATITTTQDTTAPSAPTGFAATATVGSIFLNWTNPTAADLAAVEVWSNSTNTSGTATKLATVKAQSAAPGSFTHSGLTTGTTVYYWLKAVDTSGNESGFSSGASATAKTVASADIAAGAVNTAAIAANAVTTAAIAAGAVTAALLAANAVTSSAILAGAVTTAAIAAGAVATGNIAAGAITSSLLGAGAVNTAAIAANAVATGNIAAGAVTASQLAANAVTSSAILAGAVNTAALAANAVATGNIAAGAVTAALLAANAVTSAAIAAGAVTTAAIAAGAVTASLLAANAVTSSAILAGAVTTAAIAAGAVATGNIAAGAVNTTQLAAAAVTATQIAAAAVTASKLVNTDTANMVTDHDFNDTANSWTAIGGGITYSAATDVTTTMSLPKAILFTASGANPQGLTYVEQTLGQGMPVQPGKTYLITGLVLHKVGFKGQIQLLLDWYKQDGTTSISSSSVAVGTDYRTTARAGSDELVTLQGQSTAPANAAFAQWAVQPLWPTAAASAGLAYVGAPRLYPAVTAALIVANTITATQIAAATITSAQIAAGTITASNLLANTITAGQIAAATITTAQIAAATITGANIAATTIAAGNLVANTITAGQIAAATITTTQIAASTITGSNIAAGTIAAGNILAATITSAQIAAGTITASNLLANTITAGQIAAATITTAQIAAATITGSNIAAGTIVAGNILAGTITGTQVAATTIAAANIAAATITTAQIAAATITGSNIAAGTITAGNILAATITSAQIAAGTITASNLLANTITAGQIAAATITTAQIAAATITGSNIAAGTIVAGNILAATITGTQIAATTIAAANIVANTITATQIAANTITAAQILAGTITATQIAAATITGSNLVSGTITATQIAANTITASQIAASTITATQISASAGITGTQIAAATITAANITAGTITTTQIAASTIVAGNIAAATITGAKLVSGTITATQIAAATITATQIAAATITGSNLVSGTITATQIAAATITAAKIATNTISATNLNVGDVGNLLLDVNFSDDSFAGGAWSLFQCSQSSTDTHITGSTNLASQYGVISAASALSSSAFSQAAYSAGPSISGTMPCEPGAPYRFATNTLVTSGFNGVVTLSYAVINGAGVEVVQGNAVIGTDYRGAPAGADTMQQLDTIITMPSSAASIQFYLRVTWTAISGSAGTAYLATPRLQRANAGNLTVDGSITGTKIAATTITAANIAAGTITATQIAATTITAAKIAAATITATQIAAGTITASNILSATITSAQIAASTITAANIAAATITATQIAAATITGSNLVSGTITATQIAAATITATQIAAGTITGSLISTSTSLPGTITVGATGVTIATVQSQAAAPAATINAGATLINPGLVLISGATTLASWQQGGDVTKIAGGQISANTIQANAVTVGLRGISIAGLLFSHNAPSTNSVSWSAGTITYTDNTNTTQTASITASNAAWTSGTLYVYWVQGATTLSTSTTAATANGSNNVILATYQGGTILAANYGQTLIDGSNIKTGTISATAITVTSLAAINANMGAVTAGSININSNFVVDTSGNVTINSPNFNVYITGTSTPLFASGQGYLSSIFVQQLNSNAVMTVGVGNWPVALQAQTFAVADGTTISFGVDLVQIPDVKFDTSGLAALSAGQVYVLSATSATSTGFTASLKIVTPGTITNHSYGPYTTTSGSGPLIQLTVSAGANPYNNIFNFSGLATAHQTYYGPGDYGGYTSLQLWTHDTTNGWVARGTVLAYPSRTGTTTGYQTSRAWSASITVNDSVTIDTVGVSTVGVDIDGATTALSPATSLSVSYATQSGATTGSATPTTGQACVATVTPKNVA